MKQASAELSQKEEKGEIMLGRNQQIENYLPPSMNNTQNSGPETTPSEMFQNLDRLWKNKDNFSSHDLIDESSKNATFG